MISQNVLADFCRDHVGPVDVVATRPRPDGGRLALVQTEGGARFLAKTHGEQGTFDRERAAYEQWLPELGEAVPRLAAADADSRTLLLTHIAGEAGTALPTGSLREELAHERAGAFLARLHRSEPTEVVPGFGADLAERITARLPRLQSADLLTRQEAAALRRYAERIAALSNIEVGVAHLDFTPHNWLIRPHGAIAVVDFEHTRRDAVVRDLCRLAYRTWPTRPHLRAAFLRGYRRRLTVHQEIQLSLFAAIEAVTAMTHALDRSDQSLLPLGRALVADLVRTE